MNKKYVVLPDPYYTDSDELVKYYDLTLSAGDVVTADLTKADSQGDVYACPVDPVNSLGDWINTECLQEVKDWQIYVPDGLKPIEGDEVVGKLVFQNDEVVKGVVTWVSALGDKTTRITVTEGPEGNIGDLSRAVHQTRILKAAAEPLGEEKPSEEDMEALADWERELLSTSGAILLELTEEELRAVAGEASMLSAAGKSAAAKAKALLPKPKMVTVELTEGEALQAKAGVLNNTTRDGDAAYNKLKDAINSL
jgi:hypothetical protein